MKKPGEIKQQAVFFGNFTSRAENDEGNIRIIADPGKSVPFYLVHVIMPGFVTIEYGYVIKIVIQGSHGVNNGQAILEYSSIIRVCPQYYAYVLFQRGFQSSV